MIYQRIVGFAFIWTCADLGDAQVKNTFVSEIEPQKEFLLILKLKTIGSYFISWKIVHN